MLRLAPSACDHTSIFLRWLKDAFYGFPTIVWFVIISIAYLKGYLVLSNRRYLYQVVTLDQGANAAEAKVISNRPCKKRRAKYCFAL